MRKLIQVAALLAALLATPVAIAQGSGDEPMRPGMMPGMTDEEGMSGMMGQDGGMMGMMQMMQQMGEMMQTCNEMMQAMMEHRGAMPDAGSGAPEAEDDNG